jgi:hypothetical protein
VLRLQHVGNASARRTRSLTEHLDRAARPQQSGDRVEEGRLAGSVRPDERGDARRDVEPIDRDRLLATAVDRDVPQDDGRPSAVRRWERWIGLRDGRSISL